jgi:hypothetical protein
MSSQQNADGAQLHPAGNTPRVFSKMSPVLIANSQGGDGGAGSVSVRYDDAEHAQPCNYSNANCGSVVFRIASANKRCLVYSSMTSSSGVASTSSAASAAASTAPSPPAASSSSLDQGLTLAHFRAQLEDDRDTSLAVELNLSTFETHPRVKLGCKGDKVSI